MSTQLTNYEILTGQDLNQIFAPLLGAPGLDTGFEYYDTTTNTYKDLSNLFLPYYDGTIPSTNFFSKITGKDLNLVFQGISQAVWPYINYNNQNTRQSIYNGPPVSSTPPTTKWLYQVPLGGSFKENQIVIGPTGIIYIVEDAGWIYALIDNVSGATVLFSSYTDYSGLLPPTIGANNIMYIAATNTVRAYKDINTSAPSILWDLPFSTPSLPLPLTNPNSPIIGSDGTLYVSTGNGYIFSISSSGVLNWSNNLNLSNPVYSLAIGTNGTIYASASTFLHALNSDGTLKWSYNASVTLGVPSIGADGTIYALNSSTIYAITDVGTLKWSLNVGTNFRGIVSIGNNGRLYLVTDKTVISVIDNGSIGSVNWICNTLPSASRALMSVSIGTNGTIYTTGDYGFIASITDNGIGLGYTINWAYQVISGGLVGFSSPCAIGSNGTIYFGGDHNYIVAI
jgi:hypothetical protein